MKKALGWTHTDMVSLSVPAGAYHMAINYGENQCPELAPCQGREKVKIGEAACKSIIMHDVNISESLLKGN